MENKGFVYIFRNKILGDDYCLIGFCRDIALENDRISSKWPSKCEIDATFGIDAESYINNETIFEFFNDHGVKNRGNVLFTNSVNAFDLLIQFLKRIVIKENIQIYDKNIASKSEYLYNKYLEEERIKLSSNIHTQQESKDVNKTVPLKSTKKKLDDLIGLDFIRKKIKRLAALQTKNVNNDNLFSLNYVFLGNPGTGKTEVARLMADEFYKFGIIKTRKIVEVDSSDLIGEYTGNTAPQTKRVFKSALGGVLFIDEAYSLLSDKRRNDYQQECLNELNKLMEDYRGQIVVILAGYKQETLNMLKTNVGLKSRVSSIIEFPDYTKEELTDICSHIVKKMDYSIDDEAKRKIINIVESKRIRKDFANAREVRNIIEHVLEYQAIRTLGQNDRNIILDDVLEYQIEDKIVLIEDLCSA